MSPAEARSSVVEQLTRKQRLYVEGVLAGKTKYAAALAAGYSQESARNAAYVIEREPVRLALEHLAALSVAEETSEPKPEGPLAQPQEETMEAINEVQADDAQLEEQRQRIAQHGLAASFQQWGNRTTWAVVPLPYGEPLAGPFETEEEALERAEAIARKRERAQAQESEREAQQRKEREAQAVRYELERRRTADARRWKASRLPDSLRGKSLDDYEPETKEQEAALAQARAYLADRANRVIYGGGLTFVGSSVRPLAQLLVAHLVNEGIEVRGSSLMEVVTAMHQGGTSQGAGAEMVEAPVLFVDCRTVYLEEELSAMMAACLSELREVIERRLDASRPTVLMLTCSVERLTEALGNDTTNTLGGRLLRRNPVLSD